MKKEENIQVKPWEDIVCRNVSIMVGKVLTKIEAAIPSKTQCEKLKQIIEDDIYDSRNVMLEELNNLFKEGSKE